VVGSQVYYDVGSTQLWRTDGTSAGTGFVKDTAPAAGAGLPLGGMTALNNNLYFVGSDGNGSNGLWRSDGTAAGTGLVTPLPSQSGYFGAVLFAVGSYVYFNGYDSTHGWELWRTDGTAAGTMLLKDINAGAGSSRPFFNQFCNTVVGLNGIAYFYANDGVHGAELWRSDGTTQGTNLVVDVNAGAGDGVQTNYSSAIAAINGQVFFNGYDPTHGAELWSTNGSAASLVLDIAPGTGGSNPHQLVAVGNHAYFVANDGTHGDEVWIADGNATGGWTASLVSDINATQ
jgi:ELWxxDGT repeat protein